MALGALTFWHAFLISRGETSIEKHINSKETERLANIGKVGKLNILHFVIIQVVTREISDS